MRVRRSRLPESSLAGAALVAAVLVAPACRDRASVPVAAQGQTAPNTANASKPAGLATLRVTPVANARPVVGAQVDVTGDGLPPGRVLDLTWGTVRGGWVVEDGVRFRGKQFTDTTMSLGQVQVRPDGRLEKRLTIPEDFGGVHAVTASDRGNPVAQGGIEVTQTFELQPREGPVGTMIELRATGFGWRTMESTWVVNWDNQEVGYVSATDTRGTAVARFRAAGGVGDHDVRVYTGYMGQSYLNHEQAPNAYLPRPGFVFHVTPGAAPGGRGGFVEPYPDQKVPSADIKSRGVELAMAPTQGPVQTRVTIKASGLPARAPLALVWGTEAGSRVSGNGFAPRERVLADLTTSADGTLSAPFTIPDDLGGMHTVSLRSKETTLARASFVIETSIVSMTPTSGPAGTPITIHLKGVGWTDVDNIYVATYDNAYMGYACGFNSQGDVVIHFNAAGSPGTHLIDFYPGIYQGPEKADQQLYRLPQLTYATDHPGNKIPALRFAFDVTPGSKRATAVATGGPGREPLPLN